VDLVQLVHQEEDKGTSVSSRTVLLGCLRNLSGNDIGNRYLLVSLTGHLLSIFEGLNKYDIIKNITLLFGELLQKTGLELVELDLESVELLDKLLLLLSEIGSLLPNDKGKKLILKTRLRDSKVDESGLGLDLRWIMRTLEFGVHVEVELRAEGKLLISHLNVPVLTLLDNGSSIDGLDHSVDAVLEVLKKDRVTCLDSCLQDLDHLRVAKTSDFEVSILLTFLDPGDTLELRIDDEAVPVRVGEDSTILSRDTIRRKFLIVPCSDFSLIGQNQKRIAGG
jgi:hypothetical protein